MKPKSKILVIAGSDSSGGAGIQADIKTITALGSYASTAITSITAQNTTGVKTILDIKPKIISDQIEFTVKDIRPNAVKIGMLSSTDLITPNILEAEILSKTKIKSVDDMIKASKIIIRLGCENILLKGGHLNNKKSIDVFANKKEIKLFANKKIRTFNTHGTGCTLSSAIATYYSCGKDLKKSCSLGIKYVNHAIRTAPNFGKGNGPINHINNLKV